MTSARANITHTALTTLPLLLFAGCGSGEAPAPAASSSAAASSAAASPAAAPPSGAAAPSAASSGASANAELEKREMTPFDVGSTTGEFGSPKTPPEKPPSFQKLFRQVAGGGQAFCGAHTSGSVFCWGRAPVESLSGAFVQVAVGDSFVCGVLAGGGLECGPENQAPKVDSAPSAAASAGAAPSAPSTGDAPADPSATAAAPAEVKYKAVAAGPNHMCALDREGHASCSAAQGGCALPAPPSDVSFRSLAVGTCHVCGRDSKDAVRCWAPDATAAATPPANLVAKSLVSGDGFSCAIDEKKALVCWGTAPAAPADAPAEIEAIGARGGSLCVLAKGGALRCWGALQASQPGPFTAIAVAAKSVCATVAKDRIDCFGDESEKQLVVPEDKGMTTALDPGRTSEEIASYKKRRADTFLELYGKVKELDLPVRLDRNTKIPVGPVVEDPYLPILDMVNLHQFFPVSHYHHGFGVKAAGKKFKLLVVHDGATPTLTSWSAEGRRIGVLALTTYSMTAPAAELFDCGDVRQEIVRESVIGENLEITQKTVTVLESLGRLKNKEKKIQNYCKVTEVTDVWMVSPTGSIDKLRTKSEVVHDKIADEACRGRWFKDPRGESYTASPDLPEACVRKLGK